MDPVLSQAIAGVLGAIATAILMYASFRWGNRNRSDHSHEDENQDA